MATKIQIKSDKKRKKVLTNYSIYAKIEPLTEEWFSVDRLKIIGRKMLWDSVAP